MTKYMFRYLFIILFIPFILSGQDKTVDSLKLALKNAKNDTARCNILTLLIDNEYDENVGIEYNKELEKIAKKNINILPKTHLEHIKFKKHLANSISNYGYYSFNKGDLNKAEFFFTNSLKLSKEVGYKIGIANSLNDLGTVYQTKGENNIAIENFLEGLKIFESLNDMEGIADLVSNLGNAYKDQGNIPKAIEYYTKALTIDEKFGNKERESISLKNIALIFISQGEFEKSLEYLKKSLKISDAIGYKKGSSETILRIGQIYYQQNKYIEAKKYCIKSYELSQEIGDKNNIANILYSLGNISERINKNSNNLETISYYEQSLKLYEELNNKPGITHALSGIGFAYFKQKDFHKAEQYIKKSLAICLEIGYPNGILNNTLGLTNLYKAKGNYMLTYENYKLYIKMRDSLNNIETQKATIKQQTQYEYNKQKAIEDKEHELQLKQQAEKAKDEKIRQNIIILSVSLILIIVIIFSIFLYKRIKVTQQQKAVIELKEKETQLQKHIIEEKHKEITDSINYAERIQRSFLATKEILDTNLGDYFVLFKPKDVVSGDFYWASKLNNGRFALVTADSTGHGVPGAIMSLLNITSLEKAIETLIEPSEILNATRKTIIERLKKDGSEHGGKDGMDVSLTVYDFANNKLVIAAANNPVWIVRKRHCEDDSLKQSQTQGEIATLPLVARNDESYEVIEIKPDKMPVGKHDKDSISFTQHELDLQKGDVVYTLTDGFPDQFGGEKGKKFMSKNLRELLAANAHLPMHQQKQLLEKAFSDWVGNLEQVDDVTIIGVRV